MLRSSRLPNLLDAERWQTTKVGVRWLESHSTLISRGCHYASTTIKMSDAGPYQKQNTEKRMYCFRPLDPLYAERWQTTRVGKRGGLEVRPPFTPHVAVTPQQYFEVHPPTIGMLGTRMSTLSLVTVHVLKLQRRISRSLCLQMAIDTRCASSISFITTAVSIQTGCFNSLLFEQESPLIA